MLIGEYDSKITENNRIALPKKFRQELGENLIMMNGYDGCLIIVDVQRFDALTKVITDGSFINADIRDTARFLLGSAHELDLDRQGRFVLPQSLKKFGNVKSKVIFLGLIKWIELWDSEIWETKKDQVNNEAKITSERLQGLLGL